MTGDFPSISRIKSHAVVLALLTVSPLRAQVPSKAAGNLGTVLQTTEQKVLSTCESWPPKLATKAGDQSKDRSDRHLVDGTTVITSQLASALSIDPTLEPYEYDASFMRMLDSVGTYDPNVSNDQLLGVALSVDPSLLHLWGTDLLTAKYDCLSMLGLAGQAGSNYAIPFFSLNAALKANQNASSNQTSTFIFGTFQSPIDFLYHSPDQTQRLFAGLKAIDWRLHHPAPGGDQYVSTTHVLAISKSYLASETTSLLGNMKAGLTFSVANLSADLTGQYSTSLQANSNSYITYFWQPTLKHLEPLDILVSFVGSNLPQLVPDTAELRPGIVDFAVSAIAGWPDDLCNTGEWKLTAQNPNFNPGPVTMSKGAPAAGLPVCTITLGFSLPIGVAPAPPPSSAIANPQLSLQNKKDNAISIGLPLSKSLTLVGSSQAAVSVVPAKWDTVMDATNQKTYVYWAIPGHVDVPNGRQISSMKIKTGDFACRISDTSSLPISEVKLEGAAASHSAIKEWA